MSTTELPTASPVRVRRLGGTTPPRRRRALDAILRAARSALVAPREHLASIDERAGDADEDTSRVVLYAVYAGKSVGIVDATLHTPAPGDVTIAQLAVRVDARRIGVGSTLVLAVLARAARRGAGLGAGGLHAAVLPDNHSALAFWEGLGLEVVERDRRSVLLGAPAETVEATITQRRR